MKRIFLSAVGLAMICRMNVYAQSRRDTLRYKTPFAIAQSAETDSVHFKPRKLHLDEIKFFSSYYSQNGSHSPVTAGIGTEKVTDIANGLTLNFVSTDQKQNKNTLSLGLGIDFHSSASQAFVSKTGASQQTGTRIYPSADWTFESKKTGNTFGVGVYYSNEYNYSSTGGDLHYSLKTTNKNGELAVKLQGYFDKVSLIYPSEFVPPGTVPSVGAPDGTYGHKDNFGTSSRNTYTASFAYSQIVNSRLQVAFLADLVNQNGFLSLPFHRVHFSDGRDSIEKLPSARFKLPLGVRANYFLADNIVLRSYYRFYTDDWGSAAHTMNLEVVYKITPFLSVSPFFRYYTQTASKYFASYGAASPAQAYFTSNYAYAKFNSQFFGAGIRTAPPSGVLGWKGVHELEIRYGHYVQSTELTSNVVSLNVGFK